MALSLIDINSSIQNSNNCIFVDELKGGERCMFSPTTPILGSGSFATVFKYKLKNGIVIALRVWTKEGDSIVPIIEASKEISKELRKLNSKYFVNYHFYDNAILVQGQRHPVLVMEWCKGRPLKAYIEKYLHDTERLKRLADDFLKMFRFLHDRRISHGDLQHGNIMVEDNGQIKLLDYDSLFFSTPYFSEKREVLYGYDAYQHPARKRNKYANEKVDYYSELIIYLSVVAILQEPSLWSDLQVKNQDTRLLFSENEFVNIESSYLFQRLNRHLYPMPELLGVLKRYLKEESILNLNPFYSYFSVPYLSQNYSSMYCVNCGTQIFVEDVFCYICGCKIWHERK